MIFNDFPPQEPCTAYNRPPIRISVTYIRMPRRQMASHKTDC